METEKNQFVHLHTHSHYSLLDGLNKIDKMIKKAKEQGMKALALTDHGNMHGAIEFYKACKKNGIKPILGIEAYVALRNRTDKESGIDNRRYHLTLLSRNLQGYRNLMKISSASWLEGYYYKPRIDKNLLAQYSDGIIILTGCPASEFIQNIKNGNPDKSRALLQFYIDTVGREHVFVEIMKHDEVEWYVPLLPTIKQIAEEFNIPMVATWDSHYLCKDDKEAHDTLLKINTNNDTFKIEGDYSLIDEKEALLVFKDYQEAVYNTGKVADLVDIEIELDTWVFPNFELPEGETAYTQLKKKVYANIPWRYGTELRQDVIDRIEFEIDVIEYKDFCIYMLIVCDLVDHAREAGILTNIRGSVAGSIITYLLGITNVDPLYFKLPFSRFLNKERPTAPDIDMDFADDRRDEIIEYARKKYGKNAVAQIGTFGKMLARGSVRDVARALKYSYEVGDKISKLIPEGSQGFPMTIERALKEEPDLGALYKSDSDARLIIDMAKKIEGSVRHVSVHAAGVVISPTTIDDYSPVQLDPKGGKIITQYDMHAVESAGLIKFDFLGIRNLSILADAIERVEKIRGIKIDVEAIPIDDVKTYKMLARGETMGVFQLSGGGMTKYLKDLEPTDIHDINAMVALYRPGPIEMIPEYIERKRDPRKVRFLDPRMTNILDKSYGVIVYQDDVMLIAIELGGYSWLEADKLRKAMGKKIPELMEIERTKLSKGLVDNGMSQEKCDELWALIEPFAAYGFNKAHAASYGQLAYRTAYMKANYAPEYMSAIMSAESGNLEKVAEVISECKRMGYEILPPDINESFSDFTVVVVDEAPSPENPHRELFIPLANGEYISNKIRFGLNNVKNFGEEIGKAIIRERKERGKFISIEDLLTRVHHKNFNKRSIEALIMCGALDSLGERAQLLESTEIMIKFNKDSGDTDSQQTSLFGSLSSAPKAQLQLLYTEPATMIRKLAWEKELLGLYVSGHPLDVHRERIQKSGTTTQKILAMNPGPMVMFAGIIDMIKEIMTKKGDKMAFFRVTDFSGSIECTVFSKTFNEFKEKLVLDSMVVISGRLNERNGEKSILVEKIKTL